MEAEIPAVGSTSGAKTEILVKIKSLSCHLLHDSVTPNADQCSWIQLSNQKPQRPIQSGRPGEDKDKNNPITSASKSLILFNVKLIINYKL